MQNTVKVMHPITLWICRTSSMMTCVREVHSINLEICVYFLYSGYSILKYHKIFIY